METRSKKRRANMPADEIRPKLPYRNTCLDLQDLENSISNGAVAFTQEPNNLSEISLEQQVSINPQQYVATKVYLSEEEILQQGESKGKPVGPAQLGYFERVVHGRISKENAEDVCVLVIHYDFKNESIFRNGDAPDVDCLDETFRINRNCNFRHILSPKKEILLEILGNEKKLLRLFSTEVVPDVFVLFVLSHGHENGVICTDQRSEDNKSFVAFTVDEIFDRMRPLPNFNKCLKLFNFGPCRGDLIDSKFDQNNKHNGSYKNRNATRITFRPNMCNSYVFYSTVESTFANTDETGSWFVRKLCDRLNQTEQMGLFKFLITVQNTMHVASGSSTNFKDGQPLGQTPEVKFMPQERNFIIARALDSSKYGPKTESSMAKAATIKAIDPLVFSWKSSDQRGNIRGRQAFFFFEQPLPKEVGEMDEALRQNLDFETKTYALSQETVKMYHKQALEMDHGVGCMWTSIFGKVCENSEHEISVLVGGEKISITDILHGLVGPKNEKLIGRPKILFLFDREAFTRDQRPPTNSSFDVTATNHSGWLVLVLKEKDALRELIRILQGDDLKRGKSLQELLVPLLTSRQGLTTVNGMINSTMPYLLDFPDIPRSFVQPDFTLKTADNVPMKNSSFDDLLTEIKNSLKDCRVWLLGSVAGAGKSTVLKEVAYQLAKMDANLRVLHVPLKKNLLYLSKLARVQEIEFLVETTRNTFEDINSWIRDGRALVIVDDFDEVCPNHREKVLELMTALKEKKVPLCVGTRPHEAKVIVDGIDDVYFAEIKPFNRKQQKDFLKTFGKSDQEIEELYEIFKDQDILGNPLHLSMLAESGGRGNLHTLYDLVMRQKVELYLIKDGYDKNNLSKFNEIVEKALALLRLVAFRFIMGLDLIGTGVEKEDLERINSLGVATVVEGRVSFLHQTFAEFLATQQFLLDLESSGYLDLGLFVRGNLSQCRKFLDLFLATLVEKHDIERLRRGLLQLAKSIHPLVFLERICEDKLSEIFKMVKDSFPFCDEHNASISVKVGPKLLIDAIGNDEIAVGLLEMGIIDFDKLDQVVDCVKWKVEKCNALEFYHRHLEKEIPSLPDSLGSPESDTSPMKVANGLIQWDYHKLFESYLRSGLQISGEVKSQFLFLACESGSINCVQVLFKRGVTVAMKDGKTWDPLNVAAKFGHLELAKYLVDEKESGISRNRETLQAENSLGKDWNAFQISVHNGHKNVARYLLSKSAPLLETKTNDGKSPLQLAVDQRNEQLLVWLVKEAKANLKALLPAGDRDNWTEYEHISYEHFLMLTNDFSIYDQNWGKALHCADKYKYTALVRDLLSGVEAKDEDGRNAMHQLCCLNGSLETLKLLHAKNSVLAKETTKTGQTLLHLKVKTCSRNDASALEVARFIVDEAGVDVAAEDSEGKTALSIAFEKDLNQQLIEYLMTTYSKLTESGDEYKSTALHMASTGGNLKYVHTLMNLGADPEAVDGKGRTALLCACKAKHWVVASFLVSKKVDVNKQDKIGETALFLATENNKTKLVSKLLKRGANVNLSREGGWTALHIAAKMNYIGSIRLLLKYGTDVNSQKNDGWTALHLAAGNHSIPKLLKILLDHGADVNIKEEDGWTALHVAVDNKYPKVVQMLLDNGADVDLKSNNGTSALHFAVDKNQPEIAQKLLDHGATVNLYSNSGWAPLHCAARNNNPDLVQKLIDKGADVNLPIRGIHGSTALHIAARYHPSLASLLLKHGATVCTTGVDGMGALHLAAKYHPKLVPVLLDHGAKVNSKNEEGWTALHFAALHDHPELMKILIKRGADINAKKDDGWTALHLASRNHPQLVEILLEHGADVNAQSDEGLTALHWAVKLNLPDLARKLLCHGANMNVRHSDGESALHLAARFDFPELIRLMVSHGADVDILMSNGGGSALHLAAYFDNSAALRTLLELGADVKIVNFKKHTALDIAIERNNSTLQILREHVKKKLDKIAK